MEQRIGIGFDVHAFAENRDLILGSIKIPHTRGLAGHSDADVLLHAVCDAMLGALALGDIGRHFPDNDAQYKDIPSTQLLEKTYDMVRQEGYEMGNLDCVIILENPRISSYIDSMTKNIADLLWCQRNLISIKATTSEKMGFTGREEGVAALATVILKKRKG